MDADGYLRKILNRETVSTGLDSPVWQAQSTIDPLIRRWAGDKFVSLSPSGSFAKGTANSSGTNIDFFISLAAETSETLKDIYEKLFAVVDAAGHSPKRQNVSINIRVGSVDVDLVPGKQHDLSSGDHSLYRRKADTWTKTNVLKHIAHVKSSGATDEIRILKLWRNQKGLEFPSFYLELSVIRALEGLTFLTRPTQLSGRVWRVFQYLSEKFLAARMVDPANTNNVISDDLTIAEQKTIQAAARIALSAKIWEEIVQ